MRYDETAGVRERNLKHLTAFRTHIIAHGFLQKKLPLQYRYLIIKQPYDSRNAVNKHKTGISFSNF